MKGCIFYIPVSLSYFAVYEFSGHIGIITQTHRSCYLSLLKTYSRSIILNLNPAVKHYRRFLMSYANHRPVIDPTVFIADNAVIIGDVEIGAGSSVWYGAVIRSDNNIIRLGKNVNVQDGAVIHVDPEDPVMIGDNVSIGHRAIVHGCTIDANVIVGMGAILLNGCHIGENCIIGAGALVTGGTEIPAGSLVLGAPAKKILPLSDKLLEEIHATAAQYVSHGAEFLAGGFCRVP